MPCSTQHIKYIHWLVYILEEIPFTKYLYIINMRHDPLDSINDLIYLSLIYVIGREFTEIGYVPKSRVIFKKNR